MAYLQEIEIDWNTFKVVRATLNSSTLYYIELDLQWVPFVITEGSSPIQAQTLYYTGVPRDPKAAHGPLATLTSGTKDSVVIQDITYTANVYGTSGVNIQYVNDAPALNEEYVTFSPAEGGVLITVHIVSGQSTAQQVATAVEGWNAYNSNPANLSAYSAALVSAAITPGNEGNPQVTQAPTGLSGGTPAVTVFDDWVNNFKSTGTKVASFSVGVGLEL